MERYLITQTLLSAYQYMFDCYESQAEEAQESFLRTLRREPSESTDAMLNGIEFEDNVYALADNPNHILTNLDWENGIAAIASILKGAAFQVSEKRPISVDGMDFLCYGKLDGLKAGHIYDVKFKNKSFGSLDLAGYYLDSPQHPMYLYLVPEAADFSYLVSDGEDLYIETYRREECRSIGEIIHDFKQGIESMGLMDEYKKYWAAL